MFEDDRPASPSPTLVEEYEKDPDLDIDWAGISVLHTRNYEEPSTLPAPCESFNKGICLCQSTCPYPHVCSTCFQADHAATRCSKKDSSARSRRNKKGMIWDENVSYSPCARASLDAPPLPGPPPLSELPPELVRVVRDHPKLFEIVTPINVDVFEVLLSAHPNQAHVKSVCACCREGFWPFASCPRVLLDESWRQGRPSDAKQRFLDKHVEEEIKSHRFSRPFGKKLLKGMACMPVRVAKTGSQNKFRLICDHSAGEHSLNSLIPEAERSAQVDRIDALIRVLRNRGLNLAEVVLFKSDVSHAFRILPMSPYWQALQAVKINGLYYIDRCNTFGNAGSQRLFCAFYSLVLWIAENVFRLPDIFAYVDDNFSWEYASRKKLFRRYNRELPGKQTNLLELWDCLGIPHALAKQECGPDLTITGFRIDLTELRVAVSDEKMKKLMSSIEEISRRSMVSLRECQKLAGSINWTFEVNPLLRPGITSLHNEMAKVEQSKSVAQVTITKRVTSDLLWLSKLLKKSKGVHLTRIDSWKPNDAFQTAYIHASVEGFGIWFCSANPKQAFYYEYGVSVQDSFVPPIHTFATLCAIYRAGKTWKRSLDRRPGRLTIFTRDRLTLDMFQTLRARDELHHVLLLAMELLVDADIDYLVSEAGSHDDFELAARLSQESKEALDLDYPDVVMKKFVIPRNLARRAQWNMAYARHVPRNLVSSRLAPPASGSKARDAVGTIGSVSIHKKDVVRVGDKSNSEPIQSLVLQGVEFLTRNFR